MHFTDQKYLLSSFFFLNSMAKRIHFFIEQESIRAVAKQMVSRFGKHRYIANLGHGIYPDVDPEHLAAFIDGIHEA